MNILIIDDNLSLCKSLAKHFEFNGYSTEIANDGKQGLRMALEKDYGIILLDIMMPQMDGYSVIKHLRAEGRNTPVIMITAKDSICDNIEGLELGADDYVQKPFNIDVLLAKIRAVARRSHIDDFDSSIVKYADIALNTTSNTITHETNMYDLTDNEVNILKYMIKNSSVIIPIEKISESVGVSKEDVSDILDKLMKLLPAIESDVKIIFINGVGYKLCS